MGQKSRSKKNRKQKSQGNSVSVASSRPVVASITPDSLKAGGSPASRAAASLDVQTDFVRSDIVRIALLLAIVGLVIVVFYLVEAKTSYLTDGGRILSGFLKLQ